MSSNVEMSMQSTVKLKYTNVKDGLSETDMYMLSECELIDPEHISMPSHNMKFFCEFSETNIIKIPEFFFISIIFGGCDSWHTHGYKLCSSSRRLVP